MGAARDFLELINHKGLPLFNPLVGDSHVNNRQEYDNTGSGNLQPEKWNETANPNFKLKLATQKKFTWRLVVQAFFRV
ncbi:hypothetical protein RLL94_05530, partial [Streptococcus pneumoniae]|nr:hypothetical protein [Streptococcus pneumoniae]